MSAVEEIALRAPDAGGSPVWSSAFRRPTGDIAAQTAPPEGGTPNFNPPGNIPIFSSEKRSAFDRRARGFSLVEVVLAIGIVSFAMLSIIGVFGGVMKSSSQNTERRELAEAIDSLRREFQIEDFDKVFSWVRDKKTLLYVTYKANATNGPDATGSNVAAKWMESTASGLNTYDAARIGRWTRARLQVSPSNPGGTNLSDYKRAGLHALVVMDSIATPNASLPTNSGTLEATLSLLK